MMDLVIKLIGSFLFFPNEKRRKNIEKNKKLQKKYFAQLLDVHSTPKLVEKYLKQVFLSASSSRQVVIKNC